jgi:hypothetical protein
VWTWDNTEPFGNSVPNIDPNNTGNVFEFPLRASHYYGDNETGLHYAYNTYLYVSGNPLSYIDPLGLAKNPPTCFKVGECVDPPVDPTSSGPKPSPQPGNDPTDPRKPKGPNYNCADGEPSLGACLACCAGRSVPQYAEARIYMLGGVLQKMGYYSRPRISTRVQRSSATMTLKKRSIAVFGIVIALAVAFVAGYYVSQRRDALLLERVGVEEATSAVAVMYLLDRNDLENARKTLLGAGSNGLDLAIEYESSGNPDPAYQSSRCRTLMRLKDLRQKHQFLRAPTDTNSASQSETKSAEERRVKYLDALRCSA